MTRNVRKIGTNGRRSRWLPWLLFLLIPWIGEGQFIRIERHRPQATITLSRPSRLGISLTGKKVAFGQVTGNCGQEFAELMMQDLIKGGVNLINRADLSAILAEHRFQVASSSVDPATAVQIGKLLGPSLLVFVNASRCETQRQHLQGANQLVTNAPTFISRTEAHFVAAVHTVDLASGREISVERIQADKQKENAGTAPYPEYPGEFEVRDIVLHEAAEQAYRLYFPWTETRQVSFMNGKECNLRQAYDLLRTGDYQGVLKASKENVEQCKSDPKINHQADAWYNLGVAYMLLEDYDHALEALGRSQQMHPDREVIQAITQCKQAKGANEARSRREVAEERQRQEQKSDEGRREAQAAKSTLTNESIIEFVKSGFSEDLIVRTIAAQPTAFSVTPADLLALKKAGVPDRVIAAMIDKK